MLETKKREDVDRHQLFNSVREPVKQVGGDAGAVETDDRARLQHALRAAQRDEHALRQRLHRVHDPRGMELLRSLRARISGLEELLIGSDEQA